MESKMATSPSTAAPSLEPRKLSEFERITKVFYAPSEVFEDIKQNANWIVPVVLLAIVSLAFVYLVQVKVGWETVVDNTMRAMPPAKLERIQQGGPELQKRVHDQMLLGYKVFSYLSPLAIILISLIVAAIYTGIMNFGLGAQLRFKHVLAANMYVSLPRLLASILAMIGLYSFIDPQDFDMRAPVASNPATFVAASEHPFVHGVLASFDIFAIWSTILMGIALSVLSGKSRRTGMFVAFGLMIIAALLFNIGSAF
jgi:hypothetical protein